MRAPKIKEGSYKDENENETAVMEVDLIRQRKNFFVLYREARFEKEGRGRAGSEG